MKEGTVYFVVKHGDEIWPQKATSYKKVATVAVSYNSDDKVYSPEFIAKALEVVFKLTNNIHKSWVLNENVTPNLDVGCRSTSVGDRVEYPGWYGVYECDHMGWKTLSGVKPKPPKPAVLFKQESI